MKLSHLRPVLWTDDMDATVSFYTETLGFVLSDRNEEWAWASLSKDDVALLLARPNAHKEHAKIVFTGSLYLTTTTTRPRGSNSRTK